jgi:cyclopropane fatty-acyl-phospholipid synthase-like methyltransferase
MNPTKDLWEKGDFTQLASTMRSSGEDLVASIGIEKGMKVLDLGCGDGTTAIPIARLGAEVKGVDIARNLVEAGNKRAEKEGLNNITFVEGDACDLDSLDDADFDLTISIFGPCLHPSLLPLQKKWCGSPSQAEGLSWATGFLAIPP